MPTDAAKNCPFVQADLSDFGQAFEVLSEVDDRLRELTRPCI